MRWRLYSCGECGRGFVGAEVYQEVADADQGAFCFGPNHGDGHGGGPRKRGV